MRGQAHTLEAFVAALLVLGGVVFAIQATAVTPLSASTSNQHIENQQQAQASDLLAAAAANGTLRGAVIEAYEIDSPYTNSGSMDGFAFGTALNRMFGESRIAFNVWVTTATGGGAELVDQGTPTDNAVTSSHPVVLLDDTPTGNGTVSTWASGPGIEDASPDTELFGVMEVHITVWRI